MKMKCKLGMNEETYEEILDDWLKDPYHRDIAIKLRSLDIKTDAFQEWLNITIFITFLIYMIFVISSIFRIVM